MFGSCPGGVGGTGPAISALRTLPCPRAWVGSTADPLHFPCRWSVLTYEAPKQSPPTLEEDESENPTIQVGRRPA